MAPERGIDSCGTIRAATAESNEKPGRPHRPSSGPLLSAGAPPMSIRNDPLWEGEHGGGTDEFADEPRLWRHPPPRPVVGAAGGGGDGVIGVHHLFDLGGISERTLQLRAVPVAVLLPGIARRLRPQLVRPQAGVVARVGPLLGGAVDPVGTGRLSPHLLLLPRRVLQGVLGRSAQLRGRRAAQRLLGRAVPSLDPAKQPPLLPLPGALVPGNPQLRRLPGAVV